MKAIIILSIALLLISCSEQEQVNHGKIINQYSETQVIYPFGTFNLATTSVYNQILCTQY